MKDFAGRRECEVKEKRSRFDEPKLLLVVCLAGAYRVEADAVSKVS